MKLITDISNKNSLAKTFLININLDKKFPLEFEDFQLKDEFHITLLGNNLADDFYKFLKKIKSPEEILGIYEKIENKINKLLVAAEISYGKYYKFKKEYENCELRESIIQKTNFNLYEEFFRFLEGKFGYYPKRGIPICHITIYSKNKPIGLNTYKDFEKYKIGEIKEFE